MSDDIDRDIDAALASLGRTEPLTTEDKVALLAALAVSGLFAFAAIWQIVEWAGEFARWLAS